MLEREQWLLIGGAVAGYAVAHPLLEKAVFWPLARRVVQPDASQAAQPAGLRAAELKAWREKQGKALHMKQWKFVVSMWKAVSYGKIL